MHDLEKRIIHFMQHVGIWYILMALLPLESCFENASFSKTSAIQPKVKSELHVPLLEDLDLSLKDRYIQEFFPEKVDNTSITDAVDKQTTKARDDDRSGSQKTTFWDTLVSSRSNKVKSKVFKVAQTAYSVKFYQKGDLWRAKVNDSVTKKKYDLAAHINKEDVKILASGTASKTSLIKVIPGIGNKEGYVYLGGLAGGSGKKAQEDQEKQKEIINQKTQEVVLSFEELKKVLEGISNQSAVENIKYLKNHASKVI